MVSFNDLSLALIGAGNMGSALLEGMIGPLKGQEGGSSAGKQEQDAERPRRANVVMVGSTPERTEKRAKELGLTPGTIKDATKADVIIVGVKPHIVPSVLKELKGNVSKDSLIMSVAAGATLAAMRKDLGGTGHLVRAMPNTPVTVGQGVTALAAEEETPGHIKDLATRLLARTGSVEWLPEAQFHNVIAVAGSGPAYIYYMVEAMIEGAVVLGMPRAQATDMAVQTALGAATLLKEKGTHPSLAREAVTSPGGTTARAIAALDKHAVKAAVEDAMAAAANRSKEVSGE